MGTRNWLWCKFAVVKLWAFYGEDKMMTKLPVLEKLFKGRHFERDIFVLCIRWYLRCKLGYRDLVEMMAERGLAVGHTTITLVAAICSGV